MLLSIGMMAQTVDFTGITVNTERVTKKKVYERKSFVLADGVFMAGNEFGPTALLGVRYGMVWRLGFYVGAELGVDGAPVFYSNVGGGTKYDKLNLAGYETRTPAFTLNAGLIIRLSRVVNLYLGPGLALGQRIYKLEDDDGNNFWYVRNFNDFDTPDLAADMGVFLHFGRVSMMAGASGASIGAAALKLGVGFNF